MFRALPVLALMLATPAATQTLRDNDSNAPVHWDAEHVELQSRADRAVISGSVKITQGSMKLDADRVTIAYSKAPDADTTSPEINRIDASGNVVFTKGDQVARGNMGIYDLDHRIVTMLGHVELTQGTNRLSGSRLVMDLKSGRSTLDGRSSASAGAPAGSGRVSGTFSAPQAKTTP